jgi:hypothetical protein
VDAEDAAAREGERIIQGLAGVADATNVPDTAMSICLLICSLHAFIASLYETVLFADIRFVMQADTCTTI